MYYCLPAGQIDFTADTLTMPLYRGFSEKSNQTIWYIVTDTNDVSVFSYFDIKIAFTVLKTNPILYFTVSRHTVILEGCVLHRAG